MKPFFLELKRLAHHIDSCSLAVTYLQASLQLFLEVLCALWDTFDDNLNWEDFTRVQNQCDAKDLSWDIVHLVIQMVKNLYTQSIKVAPLEENPHYLSGVLYIREPKQLDCT